MYADKKLIYLMDGNVFIAGIFIAAPPYYLSKKNDQQLFETLLAHL
jgi:hypothetical protein